VSMHKAIQAFQLAEQGFGERMQSRGILFDPALGVEAGLLAALPHLVQADAADSGRVGETIVAGALFDLMGFLTARDEVTTLSACHEASPAVIALEAFAAKRGLQLDEANVDGWRAALATQGQGECSGFIVVKEHVWDHGDGERPTLAYLWPSEFNRKVYPTFDQARDFIHEAPGLPLGWVAMEIKCAAPSASPARVPDGDDMAQLKKAVEDWNDSVDTDVPQSTLMRLTELGLLVAETFEVTKKGMDFLAAAPSAPAKHCDRGPDDCVQCSVLAGTFAVKSAAPSATPEGGED
jgi:hypothetical protein